jgi:hypothetical protein
MRITGKQLRQIIRRTLKEEATAKDIYGAILFGDERGLGEPNNTREEQLSDKFHDTFTGFMDALTPASVQKLVKLRDEGKYLDVLQVPAYAKRAWRIIEVNPTNKKFFGGMDPKEIIEPQLFNQSLSMPMFRYAVNSWTISPQALRALAKEVLGVGAFQVILSADLTSQSDAFILNPGNLQQVNQDFFWQAEIWQVAPVVCDKWVVTNVPMAGEKLSEAVELVLK